MMLVNGCGRALEGKNAEGVWSVCDGGTRTKNGW